jgi:hypothetical protein
MNDWRFGATPAASVMSGGHVGDTWKDAPSVTAASRVIPSPSNTNWNSPTAQPSDQSRQSFSAGGNPWIKGDGATPGHYLVNDDLFRSASGDPSNFYRDRTANMDLTSRDHHLYGAGGDYGFNG